MSSDLTTRAQLWSERMLLETPPLWTDRDDGFYVNFGEDEEPPLKHVENMASPGNGVIVDRYECPRIKEQVAVKLMRTSSRKVTIDTLNEEVKILRLLRHYHCIQVLGSYTHRDQLGIIMRPAAACDLNDYLYEYYSNKTQRMVIRNSIGSEFLPRLMGCLAHGLQYIHEPKGAVSTSGAQVRHRDIKPSNILLDGYRVLFADFGISKVYTATQTGTSGPSLKTKMYASPERVAGTHRNTACDIFSLGCVFAEMFTVIKGKTAEAFLRHRRENDPKGNGYFYKTVPQVLDWLEDLANERCDVQIVRLIRGMMESQYEKRPTAKQVWGILTTCTSGSKLYFCGPCCMPLHRGDPLLFANPDTDPSQTEYATWESTQSASLPDELGFKVKYTADQGPRLTWVRNLRHWDHATLDVVKSDSTHSHARKRIFLPGNARGSARAKNEAAILRKVKHRHIVVLRSTYEHSDIMMTLHFKPAAKFDLRSFLELIEVRVKRNGGHSRDFDLQKDLKFLTESFGCLSGALAEIHESGYDHGEIRPENILVHDNRIFISKFSFGLKCGDSAKGNSNESFLQRCIDFVGAMDLGSRGSPSAKDSPPPAPTSGVVLYKPPEWNTEPSEVGQPAADVFSLGCVFLEMYRVLTGGRVRDFEEQRAIAGNSAYRETLPRTRELVSSFEKDEYDTKDQFVEMVLSMLGRDSGERPTAKEVYYTMVKCKTLEGHYRCGSCPPPGQE